MADEFRVDDAMVGQSSLRAGQQRAREPHVLSEANRAQYAGRAQLGDHQGIEVTVRIHDVEDPHWMAVVVDDADAISKIGEVAVTLLDDGRYEGWSGTAVISTGGDNRLRLMGHVPLAPPFVV
jgi:hypothetical protein